MDIASTTVFGGVELINLSRDIAQINLGYLGISVGILIAMGGIFSYFNLKPLRESLNKQEDKIDELKKEASGFLKESDMRTDEALKKFKEEYTNQVSTMLKQESDQLTLELDSEISKTEKNLIDKIQQITESADTKLKEVILSEVINKIAEIKELLAKQINDNKNDSLKSLTNIEKDVSLFKLRFKNLERDLKELKVYKYTNEKKMGSIFLTIELLEDAIDDKSQDWQIPNRLEELKNQIKGIILKADNITAIEKQLVKLKDKKEYLVLIDQIRKEYVEDPDKGKVKP